MTDGKTNTGTIASVLAQQSIIVCVGAGGVGKTTLAAAMAVKAARSGRRTACLTIDPARRLADSLGVVAGKSEGGLADVTDALGSQVEPNGRLSFGMLDTKQAFAEVIRSRASSPEAVERILRNKLYRYVSGSLSGLQEYMALEKLCAIRDDPSVELIVLDTPPTSNAIDFFTAPRRMIEALDGRLVRMMRQTYSRTGFDLLGRWASLVLKTIGRITGVELLREMMEFVDALSDMFGGFAARARQVESVLLGREVAFFLIATPDRATLRETEEFRRRLFKMGLNVDGVVFNRAHWPKTTALPGELDPRIRENLNGLNRAWDEAFDREAVLMERVQEAWEGLRSVTVIPLIADGATRIDSLDRIGRYF